MKPESTLRVVRSMDDDLVVEFDSGREFGVSNLAVMLAQSGNGKQ